MTSEHDPSGHGPTDSCGFTDLLEGAGGWRFLMEGNGLGTAPVDRRGNVPTLKHPHFELD